MCVCGALDYPQNVQMTVTKGSGRNSMFTSYRARNNRSHTFNNSHMTTDRQALMGHFHPGLTQCLHETEKCASLAGRSIFLREMCARETGSSTCSLLTEHMDEPSDYRCWLQQQDLKLCFQKAHTFLCVSPQIPTSPVLSVQKRFSGWQFTPAHSGIAASSETEEWMGSKMKRVPIFYLLIIQESPMFKHKKVFKINKTTPPG